MDSRSTTQLKPAAATYTLEYRTEGGPELAPGVTERQIVLTLDQQAGVAVLEQHRSPSDEPGEPIGRFRAKLGPERFARVSDLLKQVALDELPPPTSGGPGRSVMTLRVDRGSDSTVKTFTSMDIDLIDRLDPLLVELRSIRSALLQHPEAAIQLEVKAAKGAGRQFELQLTALGSKTIALADAQTFGSDNHDRWIGVQYAELPPEEPGYTSPPLEWTRLPLQKNGASRSSRITLKPGQSAKLLTAPWVPEKRGATYLIQAIYSDYEGVEPEPNAHRIRGCLFSNVLEIVDTH